MKEFDAPAVAARLDRSALINALDRAFRAPCIVPDRQQYDIASATTGPTSGTLVLMPAWQPGGLLGVKLVTVFPANAAHGLPAVHGIYLLLSATTGVVLACLDGAELTLRRTAAASALASRYLSQATAARLLMVGAGKLAPHLIESHALVRPIRDVRIWARRPEQARLLAAKLSKPGLHVTAVEDLESSVRWADIISCATLAREPLVRGAWLNEGQHLDLVGAFKPQMREVDDEAIARAELFVDTRSGALSESGELIGAIARGIVSAHDIRADLFQLAAKTIAGRTSAAAITLFKSVGTALEDIAAAELVLAAD